MPLALFAIPSPLGGSAQEALPAPAVNTIREITDFVVENAKSARAFLSDAGCKPRELHITELHEHNDARDLAAMLAPLREGRSLGLLSEAGCPAIADPGASLIEAAHREGWRVIPLVGPSSIVLALMASGLEGQRFAFCGYLPREKPERERRIRELERRSRIERETEIFIETPYRNEALLASLVGCCNENTRLCIAADLTLPAELIHSKTIREWRRGGTPIGRRPAVFLLLAQSR